METISDRDLFACEFRSSYHHVISLPPSPRTLWLRAPSDTTTDLCSVFLLILVPCTAVGSSDLAGTKPLCSSSCVEITYTVCLSLKSACPPLIHNSAVHLYIEQQKAVATASLFPTRHNLTPYIICQLLGITEDKIPSPFTTFHHACLSCRGVF